MTNLVYDPNQISNLYGKKKVIFLINENQKMVVYRKRNRGKYSDEINPFTLLYLTLVISILVLCNILYKSGLMKEMDDK